MPSIVLTTQTDSEALVTAHLRGTKRRRHRSASPRGLASELMELLSHSTARLRARVLSEGHGNTAFAIECFLSVASCCQCSFQSWPSAQDLLEAVISISFSAGCGVSWPLSHHTGCISVLRVVSTSTVSHAPCFQNKEENCVKLV